jgi:transcriptional regulator with XRE-family HTH domain
MPKRAQKVTDSEQPRRQGGRRANPAINAGLLRSKREALGWSRARVAKGMQAVGHACTGDAVNRWERGDRNPGQDALAALCVVLALEPREAFLAP